MTGKTATILELRSENIKNISVVEIRPEKTGVVLIGGKNAAGKTSVLDSIMWAIAGKRSIQEEPIRHGEKSAEITLDLGDMLVVRRFTPSGSTVTVSTSDGAKYQSPQAILDGLMSRLAFDPLEFIKMDPRAQMEQLVALVGIDTGEIDTEHRRVFELRTDRNRSLKSMEAAGRQRWADFGTMAEDQEVAEPRPDASVLIEQLQVAVSREEAEKTRAKDLETAERDLEFTLGKIAVIRDSVAAIPDMATGKIQEVDDVYESQLAHAKETHRQEAEAMARRHADQLRELTDRHQRDREQSRLRFVLEEDEHRAELIVLETRSREITEIVESLRRSGIGNQEITAAEIREKLSVIRSEETKWDDLARRRESETEYRAALAESEALTTKLEDLAQQKRDLLSSAQYPIDGLEVSENGGVRFGGVPFAQASQAQQIRASVAMGLAANPKLKVLLIRQGAFLDDDGLALVAEMATSNGAQIWIERVGDRDQQAVIIEDGHVRGLAQPAEEVQDAVSKKPAKKSRKKQAASMFNGE